MTHIEADVFEMIARSPGISARRLVEFPGSTAKERRALRSSLQALIEAGHIDVDEAGVLAVSAKGTQAWMALA